MSLAGRILAALQGGGSFVLVTGDPPASPHLLSQALGKATVSRLAVIGVPCVPELTRDELLRTVSSVVPLPANGGAPAVLGPPLLASPLLVFDDVDRLSDLQIKDIYETTQRGDRQGTVVGVLLLARSGFLARLRGPAVRFLEEGLAAQLRLQDVGPDEAIEFLRYQLENRHLRTEARGAPRTLFRVLVVFGALAIAGIAGFLFVHPLENADEPSASTATSGLSTRQTSTPSEMTSADPAGAAPAAEPAATSPSASPPLAVPAQPLGVPQAAPPTAPLPAAELPLGRRLSPAEIAVLVARGDGFLSAGDIASARPFYERAADAGDGPAALRLGATFDPAFLGRVGVRGIPGDPDQASSWYRRARELGGAAGERLKQR